MAFSPMLEVDDPHGRAGQDNHLAAFSNCHISLMDYSGGWGDVPQRTRSLMQSAWPSSLSYTGDGYFIICASVGRAGWLAGRVDFEGSWGPVSMVFRMVLDGFRWSSPSSRGVSPAI